MSASRRIIFNRDAKLKFSKADAATPNKIGTLTGYPLVWNVLSTDRGGYSVRLMPGSASFTENVYALWHHDFSKPLADTASGTLRLSTDDVGVKCEIDLPDTSAGRDAKELVESGRVRGMSFAMVDAPEGEEITENGKKVLNAKKFSVDEVTITPIPAFTETTIAAADDDDEEDGDERSLNAQSLRLEQLKFSMMTLPEAEFSGLPSR